MFYSQRCTKWHSYWGPRACEERLDIFSTEQTCNGNHRKDRPTCATYSGLSLASRTWVHSHSRPFHLQWSKPWAVSLSSSFHFRLEVDGNKGREKSSKRNIFVTQFKKNWSGIFEYINNSLLWSPFSYFYAGNWQARFLYDCYLYI